MLNNLRKLKIALAVTALSVGFNAQSATSVFYEAQDCTSEGWTCLNATNGGWTIGSDNFIKGTTNSGTNNSWLFSPALKLKQGVSYTFTYSVRAYSSIYPVVVCDFYLVSEPTKTAYKTAVFDMGNVTTANSTAVLPEVSFTPDTDMTVYFAAHDRTVSGSGKGYILQFRNFKITADDGKTVPMPVEGLSAIPATDGSNRVELKWTNPTMMSDGTPASIASVVITRGSEPAATLTDAEHATPGGAATYIDIVPAPGKYEYSVSVAATNGERSEAVSIITGYVGTFPAIVPDHTFDFTDAAANEQWTLTATEPSQQWGIDQTVGKLSVSVSNLAPVDAAAITPAFNLDASKAYRLSYTQTATNPANTISLEVMTGNSATALETILMPNAAVDSKNATVKEVTFTPTRSGNNFFAWHATAERMTASYYTNTVSLTDISLVEIPVVPRTATEVKARAATDKSLSASITWTNPTLSETGLPVSDLTADILRDGVKIAEDIEASGIYTDTSVPCAGYHEYSVIIKNAAGATSETPEKAKSDYIGPAFDIPFTADFANNPYAWATLAINDADQGTEWSFGPAATLKANDKTMNHALLTPPLAMEADEVYELTVNGKSSRYTDYATAVYLLGPGETPSESTLIGNSAISYNTKDATIRFAIPEKGDYTIAYLIEPALTSYGNGTEVTFTINSLSVARSAKIPAVPHDIEARSMDDKKVEITWTMPSETPEGATLTDDLTAMIYRGTTVADDAEPIHETTDTPGSTLSWTDGDAAEGVNAYTLVFIYGDGQSAPATVESDYNGDAHNVLYASDFTTPEGRAEWTIVDNSTTKGNTFEFTDDNTLKVLDGTSASSSSSKLDDWIISPGLRFFTDGNIIVEFEAKGYAISPTGYSNTPYEIYVGNGKSVEALKNGIKITPSATPKLTSSEYVTYRHEYTPDAPRSEATIKKVIGLRFGGSYSYPYVEVRSIKIDSDHSTVTGIESVSQDATGTTVTFDGETVRCADPDAILRMTDVSGKNAAYGRRAISLDGLPGGLYIVTAIVRGRTTSLKIVK